MAETDGTRRAPRLLVRSLSADDVALLRIQKLSRNELDILVFGEQWRHSPQAAPRNDFCWKR